MRRNTARKRGAAIDGAGINPKNVLNTAVRLLSIRQHSVKELGAKLASKGFVAEDIEKAVAKLLDAGYLDDAKYAAALASTRATNKRWGPAKIRAEMTIKGVSQEIIKTAVNAQFAALGGAEQDAACAAFDKWLKKKSLSQPLDKKNLLRAVRFLIGRGFSPASAMEAASGQPPSRGCESGSEQTLPYKTKRLP